MSEANETLGKKDIDSPSLKATNNRQALLLAFSERIRFATNLGFRPFGLHPRL